MHLHRKRLVPSHHLPMCMAQGILPNALKAIRAMSDTIYASCLDTLAPQPDEQGMTLYYNTGTVIMS